MNNILKKAVQVYGYKAQMDMCIEEMSELTKEICKNKRGQTNRAKIIEEIADVEIMLEQLKLIFLIEPSEVEIQKELKINRLADRIERTVQG